MSSAWLLKLDSFKSAGQHNLYPKVLRELGGPIILIISKSWNNREVPEDWKNTNVVQIFKNGKWNEPGNYRLVSQGAHSPWTVPPTGCSGNSSLLGPTPPLAVAPPVLSFTLWPLSRTESCRFPFFPLARSLFGFPFWTCCPGTTTSSVGEPGPAHYSGF